MHTINRWLFPITALLLIVHPFRPTLSHSANSRLGTIKGRVVDAETRMAIPGAARVNEDRFPDYHSLNLRIDRRFHFSGSNLIVYLSVWNAYDHRNVSQYFWNEVEQHPDTLYQWSTIPILGMEFEF